MNRALLICFLVVTSAHAEIVMSGRDSRIQLSQNTSQLVLNTPLTGFNGTLELADNTDARVQGQNITFNSGVLESGSLKAFFTGVYDPTSTDVIKLQGSHRLQCNAGTVLPAITVSGANNSLEGMPSLSGSITLADASTDLTLALQGGLNQDVILNGGTLKLRGPLDLADSVDVGSNGVISFNNHALLLPAADSTWTSTLFFDGGVEVQLRNMTHLSGMWIFGAANAKSVINGNGNVLDLTTGGTLWVRSGHGLQITNATLKGLGGQSNGWILFEDQNSTLSLANVTLELAANMSVTQGSVYCVADSRVITRSNILSFDVRGTLSVDGCVLSYEPLDTRDDHNVRPFAANGINHVDLNGGQLRAAAESALPETLIFDDLNGALTKNVELTTIKTLRARGANSQTLIIDGKGFTLDLPHLTAPVIAVDNGKQLMLKNMLVRNFRPDLVQLGSGSGLIFGDGLLVQIAENIDLNYTISFDGHVVVDGLGHVINLAINNALIINDAATVELKNMRLNGLENRPTGRTTCWLAGSSARLILDKTIWSLDNTYQFTQGSLDVRNDVVFTGTWQTFALTSSSPFRIARNSNLLIDRGLTFSYDTVAAVSNNLVFEDASAALQLLGATFYATHTGARLIAGRMFVSERSVIASEAANEAEAIVIDSGFNVHMLAGASLDVRGMVIYE